MEAKTANNFARSKSENGRRPVPTTTLQHVKVRGVRLSYQRSGAGEPVILIHGSLGDYRSWTLQIPALSTNFETVTYSRRGHWPNVGDHADEPYTAHSHAEDLFGFMDALGFVRAHLVTASFGSYIGLIAASLCPERVQSLVVAEPPLAPILHEEPQHSEHATQFLQSSVGQARSAFLKGHPEEAVRRFIGSVLGDSEAYDRFRPEIRSMLMDNAAQFEYEMQSENLLTPVTSRTLNRVHCPTLLLEGERSPSLFHLVTAALHRHLPDSRVYRFAGSSHNLHAQRPREYNRIVIDFLQEQTAARKNSPAC